MREAAGTALAGGASSGGHRTSASARATQDVAQDGWRRLSLWMAVRAAGMRSSTPGHSRVSSAIVNRLVSCYPAVVRTSPTVVQHAVDTGRHMDELTSEQLDKILQEPKV